MYDIMSVESIFFDGECIEMAYRILFDSGREADLFGSKLGGLPYWDFSGDLEYPVGADGKRMQLLFQINFDEDSDVFNDDDSLPHSGMLQFFISATSGSYGLSFDDSPSDFRVVYHESVNRNVAKEDLLRENLPKGFGDFSTPVVKECPVSFEKCGQCENSTGVFVQPEFTQDPPAFLDEGETVYDRVLLQLDSSCNEDFFMWGDEGIGNFFINSDDLKNRRFEKTMYNWDCC